MRACRGVRTPTGRPPHRCRALRVVVMSRRPRIEMIVCALLLAALVVQPALGGDRHGGRQRAAPDGDRRAALSARPDGGRSEHHRRTARRAESADEANASGEPAAAPAQTASGPDTPQQDDGTSVAGETNRGSEPTEVVGAPPEDGVPGASTATQPPPVGAEQPAPPAATPDPAPAPEEAPSEQSGRGAGSTASAVGAPAGSPAAPPAAAAAAPAAAVGASTAPALSAPGTVPSTQEADTGRVAIPDAPSAGRTRPGSSGASAAPSAQARPAPGAAALARSQPPELTPTRSLEPTLVTPATEAITRVRSGGPGASSGPRPTVGDSVGALQGAAAAGGTDSSVAQVLTAWATYALGILALLVLALGVNAILAAGRTRRLERQRERLLEDVGLLQEALLPAIPARLGSLRASVAYRPADGPAAGGDFYDAFALPLGRTAVPAGRHLRPRSPGARQDRARALHGARAPRGGALAARGARDLRALARRAAGGRLRDRHGRDPRSRRRNADLRERRSPAPDRRRVHRATLPSPPPRRRRSAPASPPASARRCSPCPAAAR